MTYEIAYYEEARVKTSFSMNLNPADYIQCNSEEEVFRLIDSEDTVIDYDDCSEVEVVKCDLQIPKEFWEEWRSLKQQANAD